MTELMDVMRVAEGYSRLGNAVQRQLRAVARDPRPEALADQNPNALRMVREWLVEVEDVCHGAQAAQEAAELRELVEQHLEAPGPVRAALEALACEDRDNRTGFGMGVEDAVALLEELHSAEDPIEVDTTMRGLEPDLKCLPVDLAEGLCGITPTNQASDVTVRYAAVGGRWKTGTLVDMVRDRALHPKGAQEDER